MNHTVSSNSNELTVDDRIIHLDYPIHQTVLLDNCIIVLFDYMAYPETGQFRNLRAYDYEGKELWTAQHPDNDESSVYVKITRANPLTAWNFGCYICELDPTNGKIIKATFTK